MKYLKIPIDFSGLVSHRGRAQCSLEESIAQYIMMQVASRYGEVAGRSDFGCDIWELEFNQLVKVYEWEEKVRVSLLSSITKYEQRLTDIKVSVALSEVEADLGAKQYSQVRRKADIIVTGTIIQTGQSFRFSTSVYVSPLSQ